MNYRQMAELVPSLGAGGLAAKSTIRKYASALSDGAVVVDIGSYLGSTVALAAAELIERGIKAKIHCFDPWITDDELSRKMRFYNGIRLEPGENIQPLFDVYMEPFAREIDIIRHRQSILEARWNGPKIRLLIDDICDGKIKNDQMMKTFSPWFIPGETIIMHLDYYFFETKKGAFFRYQKQFMERNESVFHFLERGPKESRVSVFQYIGGEIDYGVMEI